MVAEVLMIVMALGCVCWIIASFLFTRKIGCVKEGQRQKGRDKEVEQEEKEN